MLSVGKRSGQDNIAEDTGMKEFPALKFATNEWGGKSQGEIPTPDSPLKYHAPCMVFLQKSKGRAEICRSVKGHEQLSLPFLPFCASPSIPFLSP